MSCHILGCYFLLLLSLILQSARPLNVQASVPTNTCSSSSTLGPPSPPKKSKSMSSMPSSIGTSNGGGKPKSGWDLARDPFINKGLATSPAEREKQQTRGLLPAGVVPLEVQMATALEQVRARPTSIDKFIYLDNLRDANVQLFYALLTTHVDELLPLVYTPTVGEACISFSHIFTPRPKGMFISISDKGYILSVLQAWPHKNIKVIVFSDGERILGLGDLGANGMGIPLGKAALYTALGGIKPEECLGVCLDVGTETESILTDPAYIGLRQRRVRGKEYDDFVEEFMLAAHKLYGEGVLLQFEDFANSNAFSLLHQWENRACSFNDDIQGTAAVALAGVLAAKRVTGRSTLKDETFLFLGAGEAALGIAELIAFAITQENEGMSMEEARRNIWLFDSKGLIVEGRGHLTEHKLPFAHPGQGGQTSFVEAVRAIRPTGIIGVSTIAKSFNKEVLELMAEINEQPLVFALSNPTSKSECTFEEAVQYTKGKVIFASGSPFPSLTWEGKNLVPGQSNNCYIFPGLGLSIALTQMRRVTMEHFYLAANTVAEMTSEDQLAHGCLFPPLGEVRDVSAAIAAAVAEREKEEGRLVVPDQKDWLAYAKAAMYDPLR